MKSCPQCHKTYADETLNFCLDDGEWLLSEPGAVATGVLKNDEPQTAVLSESRPVGVAGGLTRDEAPTRLQMHTTAAEAEPRDSLGGPSEKQSFSANRAAKRRGWVGGWQRRVAVIGLAAVVLVGGYFGYRYFSTATSKQIESIAVMPFVNDSGNPDIEYLSDGMTEELIGTLQQIPKINVKARSSVIRYKDKDAQTIGRDLNVQAILNGRVVQHGQALTLYVELVDARTENSLWRHSYNKAMTDLVSLQNDVARDVAERLKISLSGEDEKRLAKNYTTDPEAYRLYLLGRSYWNKRGSDNIEKAIGKFQEAIDIDPNFALAYAGLAEAYAQPSQQPNGMEKARAAAKKALSLDGSLAEAHAAIARVLAEHDYNFSGAEQELRRAIALDPGSALAHSRYGILLSYLGRFEAADAECRRALELEPLSPGFNTGYGSMLTYARHYDEAITQLKKSLDLDQSLFLTHGALSTAYQLKGNYSDSVEERARSVEIQGKPEFAAGIRESFVKGGWEGYLRYMTRSGPEGAFGVAPYHVALGEKDQAFAVLNDAFEKRSFVIVGIKVNPLFDPLRDDPRFAEVLKKVGFPE